MTHPGWCFSTSNKGWKSDFHGFEWLSTRFEPKIRRNDKKQRLLVINGHFSHLTATFLRFCITKDIDLALLPPHTSHITQPLDIAYFGPPKTAINIEIDRIFRHSTRRLQRAEWTQAYITARAQCFKPAHVDPALQIRRNLSLWAWNSSKKGRKKGKRVVLQGQFISSRESILEEIETIGKEASEKR